MPHAIAGVDSHTLYLGVIALVAVQRLAELALSRRNLSRALARGGRQVEGGHYPVMVVLHALFLIACPLEVFLFDRPFVPPLAVASATVLLGATALRYWAIGTLGERWNTRIVVLPGAPAIATGPYRFLRHPNYLAVIAEFAALPLLHTAWLSALAFSLANGRLLKVRIAAEERALAAASDYGERFARHPRLVPTPSAEERSR